MKSDYPVVSISEPVPAQDNATPHPAALTSGRLLARNTLWNLVGACAPVLVAIVCLPVLKRTLGTDRLGIISLAWVVVGYFGFFDLGLSRAITKLVAERLGQQRAKEIPPLVWTSLFLMAGMGMAGALATFFLSPWLVRRPLRIPSGLQQETLYSFYWLSLSIPVVVVTAGLRGVLEALQRFRLATAIRVPMGVFSYLSPILILPFSHSLVPIMATLVLGRTITGVAHLWACLVAMPALRRGCSFHASAVRPLLRFGTWMTVSNIVGPLMVSFDRFLIGSVISVSAVAYYAVPYEVVMRLSLIAVALVGVLFPAFSTAVEADRARLIFLYECGLKYIFLALFPFTLVLIAFAPEALRFWLGNDFALNSAPVARALAVAVFINSLAQVPFTHVQGAGRPDITAKFHLVELPLYGVALFLLARSMGIWGVAIAWLLRTSLDAVLLFAISWHLLPENRFIVLRLPLMTACAGAAFLTMIAVSGLATKIILVGIICLVAIIAMWRWMLSPREKTVILSSLQGNQAIR